MAIDWTADDETSPYLNLLDDLLQRDVEVGMMNFDSTSHIPEFFIKYHRAGKLQERQSGAWVDQVIAIDGGGTGAATAAGARTTLGLGTMATQNSNAVAVTGGAVAASLTGSTNIPAAGLTGTIAQARLGTGSVGAGEKFLADDQTYKAIVPPGAMTMYAGAVTPTGWLLCDGTSYLQSAYPALFAAIGIVFGGSATNFNVPDMRQRFPLGKTGAGTGAALGSSGGTIDHTHGGPFQIPITILTATAALGADFATTAPGAGKAVSGPGTATTLAQSNPPFLTLNYIIKT